MEELNLGVGEESAGKDEADPAPTLTEANAFMSGRGEVHGVGVGATEDGERCVVLLADGLPAEVVPDRLDGLPVRVHDSDSFAAQQDKVD